MRNYLTLLFFTCLTTWAFAQTGQLSGKVTDESSNAVIGAKLILLDTGIGASTNEFGEYAMTVPQGTYSINISFFGFSPIDTLITVGSGENVILNVSLSQGSKLDEVIISASKKPEKLTESPATIQTVYAREIDEYPGNPAELIARQKGIDYFRAGIATPGFNIRGFNSNFNSKNLQVVDGRISTLVATGLPFGPLSTNIKEDIQQLEVILGPNATLYGPNAHNGLLNTVTKDPRQSPGTTSVINPGVNGDGDMFFSSRFRHAQVVNDKFAFKFTGEYTRGTEFDYVDSVFIDRVGGRDSLGNAIPDGRNEGYEEFELDPEVEFVRAEAALYFSPNTNTDIIFNTGYSNSTYLSPTNVGRNQIRDWSINYYQLRFTNKNWFAQVYYTLSRTDSTYAIDQRTKNYYALLDAGVPENTAGGKLSLGNGALFQDNSERLNAEVQYNNEFGRLSLVTGAQYQLDMANSKNTYLLDGNGDINVAQIGAYAHLTYDFGGGWRGLAAARADNHEIYDFNFVPKLGILNVGKKGTWRLTYGQGIAAPTILNMFGDLFSGLILGNSEGFTLADGSTVEKQKVEKLQTIELGYRGLLSEKLYLDANAYYNISKDFLSPLTIIGVATQRGNTPIQEVQSSFNIWGGLVGTYINFGQVNTYGVDVGLTYYITPELSARFNYSYFDYSVDEDDPENDFNGDGTVNFLDILVNAPTNKGGVGLNYSGSKWVGNFYARWVEEYYYFSSFQIASETIEGLTYRGVPIVEDARSADTYNFGPLGGFVTVDASLGYRINESFSIAASASNLFNQDLREFTAAPPTRGLYTLELKVNLPTIGNR